jgi:formate dehydrogenase maturation protein FdhE
MQYCVVCDSTLIESFKTSDKLLYWHCNSCEAKFLDNSFHINADAERVRYLEHENIVDDKGYRNFLSKLTNPLKEKLSSSSTGLDFGCGHGPALADILTKDNFKIDIYDNFFFTNKDIFSKTYYLITCK